MKELQSKLNEIQQKLVAPKNQFNEFGNYNYRSAEDILSAVKDLLGEAVLVVNDEIIYLGDRYYVKATATLKLGDNEINSSAFAREPENQKKMNEAQITGSASSYARKYALNGLFCIDDSKDADSMDNREPEPKNETMITETQKKTIDELVTSRGRTISEVCKIGKIESLDELSSERAYKLIELLKGLPEATLQ